MAKFVSDIQTQLPKNKILVTDENSIIKTSDVTKDQLEEVITVEKYSELPVDVEENSSRYVKHEDEVKYVLSDLKSGDTITNLYIELEPSLEGITIPEPASQAAPYQEGVGIISSDGTGYEVMFSYGQGMFDGTDNSAILAIVNMRGNSMSSSKVCMYFFQDGTMEGDPVYKGWYSVNLSTQEFSPMSASDVPNFISEGTVQSVVLGNYTSYSDTIISKFLLSSSAIYPNGHYIYENGEWLYNEEELTVDTYNQLPVESIKQNQLAYVKNTSVNRVKVPSINSELFTLENTYNNIIFVTRPDIETRIPEVGFVGTIDIDRPATTNEDNIVSEGEHTYTVNNGYVFSVKYLDEHDNDTNYFIIEQVEFFNNNVRFTGKEWIYTNREMKYGDNNNLFEKVTLKPGWNQVIIPEYIASSINVSSENVASSSNEIICNYISHNELISQLNLNNNIERYISQLIIEEPATISNDKITEENIVKDYYYNRLYTDELHYTSENTNINKFILVGKEQSALCESGHYIFENNRWVFNDNGILKVNSYEQLPEYTISNTLAYAENDFSNVTFTEEVYTEPFNIAEKYSGFTFVEQPELQSDLQDDSEETAFIGDIDLHNGRIMTGFAVNEKVVFQRDSDYNRTIIGPALVIQRITEGQNHRQENNKWYFEFYVYSPDYYYDVLFTELSLITGGSNKINLSSGWNSVVITMDELENIEVTSTYISHQSMMNDIREVVQTPVRICRIVESVSYSNIPNKINENESDNVSGIVTNNDNIAIFDLRTTTFNNFIHIVNSEVFYSPSGNYIYEYDKWSLISSDSNNVIYADTYENLPEFALEGQIACVNRETTEITSPLKEPEIGSTPIIDIKLPLEIDENIIKDIIKTLSYNEISSVYEIIYLSYNCSNYMIVINYDYDIEDSTSEPSFWIQVAKGDYNSGVTGNEIWLYAYNYNNYFVDILAAKYDGPGWYHIELDSLGSGSDAICTKKVTKYSELPQLHKSICTIETRSDNPTLVNELYYPHLSSYLFAGKLSVHPSGHYIYTNNKWVPTEEYYVEPNKYIYFPYRYENPPITVLGSEIDAKDICIYKVDTSSCEKISILELCDRLLYYVNDWENDTEFNTYIVDYISSNSKLYIPTEVFKTYGPYERASNLTIDVGSRGHIEIECGDFQSDYTWQSIYWQFNEPRRTPDTPDIHLREIHSIVVQDNYKGVTYEIDSTLSTNEFNIIKNIPKLQKSIEDVDTILTQLNSGEGV